MKKLTININTISRKNISKIILSISLFCNINFAYAGLFDDEEARRAILEIRQQINNNKQSEDQKYEQLQTSILSLQNQIEGLKAENNSLNGQLEVSSNELSKLKNNYQLLANNYNDKLMAQEKSIGQLKDSLENYNADKSDKEKIIGSNQNLNLIDNS